MTAVSSTRTSGEDAAAALLETLHALLSSAGGIPEHQERMAGLVASVFADGGPLDDARQRAIVTTLYQLATSEHPPLQELGQSVIFSHLVEGLSDSFSAESVDQYDRVFARLITLCRGLPGAAALDSLLARFGIGREQDLLDRRARTRTPKALAPSRASAIRTVFALSRVTLGADVAITSLILQKVRQIMPRAAVVLLAPAQLDELLGGDGTLSVVDTPYPRRGGLLTRIEAWIDLVRILDRECAPLGPGEFLIIDPDSRLTQLGLLPVTDDDANYYFFESRSFQRPGLERIGELGAAWLSDTFGAHPEPLYPRVSLRSGDLDLGRALARRFLSGHAHVVSVNFGVGGNPRKRVGEAFEVELARRILAAGSALVLDKGVGEEREQANRILAHLRADGRTVVDATEPGLTASGDRPSARCDVLAWEGGIGAFSALIGASDLYIGYDSAFQHIAAALDIPVIDIFTDSPGPVFLRRWQPYSKNAVRVVAVDRTLSTESQSGLERSAASVLDVYRELRDVRPAGGGLRP